MGLGVDGIVLIRYGLTEVDYTSWDVPDGNSPEHGL